jgi:hypothetical protein
MAIGMSSKNEAATPACMTSVAVRLSLILDGPRRR